MAGIFKGAPFAVSSGGAKPSEATIDAALAALSSTTTKAAFKAALLAASIFTPASGVVSQLLNLVLYGISDWDPEIGVTRTALGQYVPTAEYADKLAAFLATTTTRTYYTDPASAGGDGSQASPFTNISNAWAAAPTEATLRIKAKGNSKGIIWGSRGITGLAAAPTRNIILEEVSGGELIIFNVALTDAPTVTDNGDGTFSMRSGSNSAPTSPAVDWSPASRAEHVDGLGKAFTTTSGATALDATGRAALQPGQAFKQTGLGAAAGDLDFTFRPFGNRAQSSWDGYICPPSSSSNGLLLRADDSGQGDSPRYFLNRVFVSGGVSLIYQNRRTSTGGLPRLYLNRCGTVGSGGNALSVIGACLVTTFDWKSDASRQDGLNIHSTDASQSTWISGKARAVHVRPTVNFAGLSNSATDNNETGHEDTRSLTIMPTYRGSNGRVFAFIDNSKALVLGGSIARSTRSDAASETISAGGNAELTLVEVSLVASQGATDIGADTTGTAKVRFYGMTKGALRTLGDVTFGVLPT